MKHFPLAILLVGLASITLSPLSCRWVRASLIPLQETSQKINGSEYVDRHYETDLRMVRETKRFLTMFIGGIILLCIGGYFRGLTKTFYAVDRVMLHFRYCSKCGKPLSRKNAIKVKQFSFIPRMSCPDCGGFAQWSSAVFFALGLALFFSPFLAFSYFDPTPKIFDTIGDYLLFIGFILFMTGLLRNDRQVERAKRYVSSLNQPKP